RRDSPFANGALVVTVDTPDFGADDLLAGMRLQRRIEAAAFAAGGGAYHAPAQRLDDFLAGRKSAAVPSTSYRPGVVPGAVAVALPPAIVSALRGALVEWGRRLPGFVTREAVLVGVETRTSAPVRLDRDPRTLESPSHRGLYPCGEGAGYAGGIVSAALDGQRVAEQILVRARAWAGRPPNFGRGRLLPFADQGQEVSEPLTLLWEQIVEMDAGRIVTLRIRLRAPGHLRTYAHGRGRLVLDFVDHQKQRNRHCRVLFERPIQIEPHAAQRQVARAGREAILERVDRGRQLHTRAWVCARLGRRGAGRGRPRGGWGRQLGLSHRSFPPVHAKGSESGSSSGSPASPSSAVARTSPRTKRRN